MRSKDAHGMTNTVNPDQEQSDLDLQCLPRKLTTHHSMMKQT